MVVSGKQKMEHNICKGHDLVTFHSSICVVFKEKKIHSISTTTHNYVTVSWPFQASPLKWLHKKCIFLSFPAQNCIKQIRLVCLLFFLSRVVLLTRFSFSTTNFFSFYILFLLVSKRKYFQLQLSVFAPCKVDERIQSARCCRCCCWSMERK